MSRLAFASLAFVLTLALSACAGPIPQDIVSSTLIAPATASTAAVDDALPPPAFTFGELMSPASCRSSAMTKRIPTLAAPRPASDPLPSQTPGTPAKLEMDWLS
ncbi:uncharacterized protein TRAVEDRAFT_24155 [Trametes versicolor FP-101664 SS1]|uniref:uncharacterized protein n=1 Tax=Trametes versicolor (strain FP-101664) TaxID=717944 RepID=UPI000462300D|nr:uncharacterized protein TRAVEDRAFT_24155 [Trametes versicolor FP-101664 SS1]EIW52716.1 hypothetical protein TRAVEDRAFT_24155 [Trametes versicolor FP-101664 SS1]